MNPGKDLDEQAHKLTGKIAALEAAAGQLRKTANDMDRDAARKRGKLRRVVRQQVELALVDARNEERAREAAAVPADEEN